MRYSNQREMILNVVRNSFDHPDASLVYERVKKIIHNISLGTVYRNLNVLSNEGYIRRIPIKDGNDRFDKTPYEHNHIHCKKCDKVVDIDLNIELEKIKEIERITGFKITNCNFKIDGLCKSCKEERKD